VDDKGKGTCPFLKIQRFLDPTRSTSKILLLIAHIRLRPRPLQTNRIYSPAIPQPFPTCSFVSPLHSLIGIKPTIQEASRTPGSTAVAGNAARQRAFLDVMYTHAMLSVLDRRDDGRRGRRTEEDVPRKFPPYQTMNAPNAVALGVPSDALCGATAIGGDPSSVSARPPQRDPLRRNVESARRPGDVKEGLTWRCYVE
jgi:hypothetical protein